MKITSLQISNILSFQHQADINNAEKITFDDGLNIIIGENGAGKSTALEVINFIFKRILYKQYNVNQDLYSQKSSIPADQKKQILQPVNNNSFVEFRLEPNWYTENDLQVIRIEIKLDEIDLKNIEILQTNLAKLNSTIGYYTVKQLVTLPLSHNTYTLDVTLNKNDKSYTIGFKNGTHDFGFEYLTDYNFFKEAIALYNLENPTDAIDPLFESFTLISSYRNYHAFDRSVSLKDQEPSRQIQHIRNLDFSRSMNTSDKTEPTIFGLVRLRVAEKHFDLMSEKLTEAECEAEANKLSFITDINKRLKVVNLECKIRLIEKRTWQYNFEFFDLRRKKAIADINSLSAGQKAIVHLVFEAYGRGDLKGGLVVIDEPEIHLHYQFQNEYLQVIRELNKEQKCQYVLVTHSEALINSSTINQVRRFSLSSEGYTRIKAPVLSTDQKVLIRILDNTRSTYAFFAKKVVLVEGDSDRYFFKAIIQEKYPELEQEIAILYVNGKGDFVHWIKLFEAFGLIVHSVADFDYLIERSYPSEKGVSLKTQTAVADFKARNIDWETKIDADYANRIYILKNGDLEHYLGIKKDLAEVINFCNTTLPSYLAETLKAENNEISEIVRLITT